MPAPEASDSFYFGMARQVEVLVAFVICPRRSLTSGVAFLGLPHYFPRVVAFEKFLGEQRHVNSFE